MVTGEDVIAAYRLILGREPESEEVIRLYAEQDINIYDLRNIFMNSREFKGTHSYLSNKQLDITLMSKNSDGDGFFAVLDSNSDDPVSSGLRHGGFGFTELAQIFKKPGVFLDLGANVGAFSLYMASIGWRGIAFEASKVNASLLRKSIHLNDYDISLFEKAVFSRSGRLLFRSAGPFGLVFNDDFDNAFDASEYDKVACVALDDEMEAFRNTADQINLIKLDIEGSELAALIGMRDILKVYDYPPIFMEVNAFTLYLQSETPFSLLSYARNLGYQIYTIEEEVLCSWGEGGGGIFPIIVNQDVLLLKDIPAEMPYRIINKTSIEDKDVVEWIVRKLHNRDKWEHYDVYIYYVLKDFPKYYNDPNIFSVLSEVACSRDNDPYVDQAISWFKEIGRNAR